MTHSESLGRLMSLCLSTLIVVLQSNSYFSLRLGLLINGRFWEIKGKTDIFHFRSLGIKMLQLFDDPDEEKRQRNQLSLSE